MDYPQAEWDKAGEILMHTPWEELFDGVTVEWVPLESLIDGYGAAHCMTQVLKRASAKQ